MARKSGGVKAVSDARYVAKSSTKSIIKSTKSGMKKRSRQSLALSQDHVHQILGWVYDRIDYRIWQKAVSIYRSGELSACDLSAELMSATVHDHKAPSGKWYVHFKMHGGGGAVRWFECGCSYARRTGGLCEHLLASFIQICRENPKYLLGLNPKAPFATSSLSGTSRRSSGPSSPTPSTQTKGLVGYLFDLVSLSKFHSLKVHPDHGTSEITFELRRSFIDTVELSVDETKTMLLEPSMLDLCKAYMAELEVLPYTMEPGWKAEKSADSEVWYGQKKLLLWVDDTDSQTIHKLKALSAVESSDTTGDEDCSEGSDRLITEEKYGAYLVKKKRLLLPGTLELLNSSTTEDDQQDGQDKLDMQDTEVSTGTHQGHRLFSLDRQKCKGLGKNTLYVPGLGYLNFRAPSERSLWARSPHQVVFRGQEIDRLIATEFRALRTCPTLVSESWLQENITDVRIIRIELYSYDGYQFVLDPKYMVAGQVCSVSQLLKLAKDKNRQFIFENNHWIRVPDILLDLDFQISEDGSSFKLDTIALLRWRSLFDRIDDLWCGEEHLLQNLHDQMTFHDTRDDKINLDHTHLRLRDYQMEGLRWLWWLYKNRLHGLLADDMGLGKTHQTMALLSLILSKEPKDHEYPRFLVICPTTVVGHWHEKIDEFAPILQPLRYHGGQRNMKSGYTTLITSYGVLLRDVETLSKIDWDVVLCDEAHMIKNPKTSTYWACRRLNAHMRLCLSGTPIENRLYELKTLFDFLLPGYLGSQTFFKKYYEVAGLDARLTSPMLSADSSSDSSSTDEEEDLQVQSVWEESQKRQNSLKRLIEPLKMRRTKAQVLDDLPEKVEDVRHCRLSDRQKELYSQTLEERASHLLEVLSDRSKPLPYLHVFSLLQRLKQICNHPSLITGQPWQGESSEKFDLLKELLDESLNSSHKVVIFSQYVKMIEIITAYLETRNVECVTLVGHSRNREQLVSKFQNDPQVPVFVGSLLAGGVGIDLTAASVVIHYDRWWNASKENQATDRVHRIGQKKSLLVLKLVTLDTIEEKIDEMIHKKQQLFDVFMAQNPAHFKQFSREELIDLVSSDLTL